MTRWQALLRYDWPLHCILLLTNWLPDNVVFLALRGRLAAPFFGQCGTDLRLGRNTSFYNPSNIRLGSHVYLAYGCILLAGAARITLCDEVILGPYCVLASNNHTRQGGSFRYGLPDPAPITVGAGTWLGAHVTLTAGTVIGCGALVAAGAVVTSEIPAMSVAGGVPARVINSSAE